MPNYVEMEVSRDDVHGCYVAFTGSERYETSVAVAAFSVKDAAGALAEYQCSGVMPQNSYVGMTAIEAIESLVAADARVPVATFRPGM